MHRVGHSVDRGCVKRRTDRLPGRQTLGALLLGDRLIRGAVRCEEFARPFTVPPGDDRCTHPGSQTCHVPQVVDCCKPVAKQFLSLEEVVQVGRAEVLAGVAVASVL